MSRAGNLKIAVLDEAVKLELEKYAQKVQASAVEVYVTISDFLKDFYLDQFEYDTFLVVAGSQGQQKKFIKQLEDVLSLFFDSNEISFDETENRTVITVEDKTFYIAAACDGGQNQGAEGTISSGSTNVDYVADELQTLSAGANLEDADTEPEFDIELPSENEAELNAGMPTNTYAGFAEKDVLFAGKDIEGLNRAGHRQELANQNENKYYQKNKDDYLSLDESKDTFRPPKTINASSRDIESTNSNEGLSALEDIQGEGLWDEQEQQFINELFKDEKDRGTDARTDALSAREKDTIRAAAGLARVKPIRRGKNAIQSLWVRINVKRKNIWLNRAKKKDAYPTGSRQVKKDSKKKGVGERIQMAALVLASAAFLISGGFLIYHEFIEPSNSRGLKDDLSSMYNDTAGNSTGDDTSLQGDENSLQVNASDTKEVSAGSPNTGRLDLSLIPTSFHSLYQTNQDVVGWITVQGTQIDYPVVKTDNNEFYLEHDYMKNYTRYGTVFADCENVITPSKMSQNISIYGHDMNDGSMFGELDFYRELSFLKKHPYFTFNTLYGDANYVIYGVFITNTQPQQDSGKVFEWRMPEFSSDAEFEAYVNECKKRSLFETPIEVSPGDTLVSLSTCTWDFDDARLVVVARKVNDNESFDFSQAKENKQVLYPQAWYDVNGGKKPELS